MQTNHAPALRHPGVRLGLAQPSSGAAAQVGGRVVVIDPHHRSNAIRGLIGRLQAQHGWNRERAAKELRRRLDRHQRLAGR